MTVENAQFISELNPALPPGSDPLAEGDDHLRVIKQATQQSFPNVDAVVNATSAEMNEQPEKNVAESLTAEWDMVAPDSTQRRMGYSSFPRLLENSGVTREVVRTDEGLIIFGNTGNGGIILEFGDTVTASDFRQLAMCGVLNNNVPSGILLRGIGTATLSYADNTDAAPAVINELNIVRSGFVVIWRVTSNTWWVFGDATRT